MLSTLICLNGKCREAIEFYEKALNATVKIIIPNKENDKLIDHSEVFIHDCLLMLNDFGGSDRSLKSNGYLLSLKFENEEELNKWLELNYDILFEEELNGWYTDPALWPKGRSLHLFKKWCSFELHTMVFDTGGSPLEDDET